jgi:hypothetical protein
MIASSGMLGTRRRAHGSVRRPHECQRRRTQAAQRTESLPVCACWKQPSDTRAAAPLACTQLIRGTLLACIVQKTGAHRTGNLYLNRRRLCRRVSRRPRGGAEGLRLFTHKS